MTCDHDFIKEDEANDFAEKLKKEMENHKEKKCDWLKQLMLL